MESLYKSGNSVPLFDSSILIGCNKYTGTNWGCPENSGDPYDSCAKDRELRIGLGFNGNIPLYENSNPPHLVEPYSISTPAIFRLDYFVRVLDKAKIEQWINELKQKLNKTKIYGKDLDKAGYQKFMEYLKSRLTTNHPVLIVEETEYSLLDDGGGSGGSGIQNIKNYGSKEIYIMIHNLGTKVRKYLILFACPTGVSQEEYQKWLNQPDCDHPYECKVDIKQSID
ncbi:MAG: hypothetical protein QW286_02350 [Candidatus Aenigmatarchaeota archaeon]